MAETFIIKMQSNNRVTIPEEYVEVLKLAKGDKIRMTIEKVRK